MKKEKFNFLFTLKVRGPYVSAYNVAEKIAFDVLKKYTPEAVIVYGDSLEYPDIVLVPSDLDAED